MCPKHYQTWRLANDPVYAERVRAKDRARYAAAPEKKIAASTARYAKQRLDAEWREAQNAALRERTASPEAKARKSEKARRRRSDPVARVVDSRTQQRWIAENPERRRETQRVAQARRESLKAGIDPTGVKAALLAEMHLKPCARCSSPGPCEIDHIIPLSWVDGCPEVAEVLGQVWAYQPLCKSCNSAKHNKRVECYVPTGDIGME